MPFCRTIAVGLSSLVVLGATLGFAQRAAEEAALEPTYASEAPGLDRLDPNVIAVRLLLGETDNAPRSWSGRVKLDRGEILAVEGGRFRKGDAVQGRDAWTARSLVIRKTAAKAAAKKKANVSNPAIGGPGNSGRTVVPTVVTVSLRAPADSTLEVETESARFAILSANSVTSAPSLCRRV
ncbi:MAG: hypothetical protein U0794_09425 [Isosphaeraceae bacterium]